MFMSSMVVGLAALAVLFLSFLLFKQYQQKRDLELELIKHSRALSDLQLRVHEMAGKKFEEYKEQVLHLEQHRIVTEQNLMAQANFERWKMEYETVIRQDAIKKSQAVTIGKVTEHIIPFFSGVFPYNPKEARFIGSPIDLIVFDNTETDLENVSIHFIEVKTATSSLTSKQKAIKYAVLNKRVEWKELRV